MGLKDTLKDLLWIRRNLRALFGTVIVGVPVGVLVLFIVKPLLSGYFTKKGEIAAQPASPSQPTSQESPNTASRGTPANTHSDNMIGDVIQPNSNPNSKIVFINNLNYTVNMGEETIRLAKVVDEIRELLLDEATACIGEKDGNRFIRAVSVIGDDTRASAAIALLNGMGFKAVRDRATPLFTHDHFQVVYACGWNRTGCSLDLVRSHAEAVGKYLSSALTLSGSPPRIVVRGESDEECDMAEFAPGVTVLLGSSG